MGAPRPGTTATFIIWTVEIMVTSLWYIFTSNWFSQYKSNSSITAMANILLQIRLLLWKRYSESIKSKYDLAKLFVPSILFFTLLILLYNLFGPSLFTPGLVEQYLVPLSFWVFVQRIVVQIMFEKNSRLQESMRMMGLSDIAYWSSYFISEGVITGFLLSFLCTIFTVGGLFNNANFGTILGLLFIFCLSAGPFAFFVCAFFDTPQTSGQATLALLLGHYCIDYSPKYFVSSFLNFVAFYVIYIAVYIASVSTLSIPFRQAQIAGKIAIYYSLCVIVTEFEICVLLLTGCFFPPLGLQIGCAAFTPSYDGISIQSICGILVCYNSLYGIHSYVLIHSFHTCDSSRTFSSTVLWRGTLRRCGLPS